MYEYPPMLARISYQERLPRALRSVRTHEAERTSMALRWTTVAALRYREAVTRALMALATQIAPTVAAPYPGIPALAQ